MQEDLVRGSAASSKGSGPSGFTLKILYLFSGADRKTSVVEYLRQLARKNGWAVEATELDLKRNANDDLSQVSRQAEILDMIAKGLFHAVLCTPPCSTWTRVRFANMRGPPPLRTSRHLWGFPWVKDKYAHEIELGNELVRFSIQVWAQVARFPTSKDGYLVFIFGEHPEDLGAVVREEDKVKFVPASIWQIPHLRTLVDDPSNTLFTVAISQCCWGAAWRKPTRLLGNVPEVATWGPSEWPQFDNEGFYAGPLIKTCQCTGQISLVRTKQDASFRTTGTDVYPERLDRAIAQAIINGLVSQRSSPDIPAGGVAKSGESQVEDKEADMKGDKEGPSSSKESEHEKEKEWPDKQGRGRPIQCYYKGKKRTIHDGGGLCSPGRWPVEARRELEDEQAIRLASRCKKLFLKWVMSLGNGPGDQVKEVFWSLAGGKVKASPFQGVMNDLRKELDEDIRGMGLDPDRQGADRKTEVNFRRLQAMLRITKDEDHEWLSELAAEGVNLGVDLTMPRVPKVFEEKTKWNLDFTEEGFKDSMAANYKSAEENAEDIERQVMEEVESGSIVPMTVEEAQARFKGRLAVASLGAVPKELGSSVVRIVHDGSYSVDVNHRIKVLDRMRFPIIDDASGVLLQLERDCSRKGGAPRCSLLYDVSKAHKLVPVKEQDWGYQAFRLPGGRQDGKVFVHTTGTFGIASAAYYWQRLAAGVVRLLHRIAGRSMGVLHLLFADDGWLTSSGSFFWRRLLFWMFCLELVEVPISWKKVRGGLIVQWIGYQLDVELFRQGISDRKVKWILEWIEKHLQSGGVMGRDLKSALGRFSFVAGALPHVRPFLGPLFAWSAVLGQGTYAAFPDAIAVLLEFIREEVSKEPMRKPRWWQDDAPELFRVDAKAEGETIVIGGWEVTKGGKTEDARWFSIVLNRKNAPWAYVKGQPFRSIASLELCAVLVATMLFGERAVANGKRSTLTLGASTDNLGNTHVLTHFMSCKYPLSIVVMELAAQMKKFEMELNLGWVPRGQNVEADALTNSEFEGFDPDKRINVAFEDLPFLVMDRLMAKAAELDGEIKLAKSSKEVKGDRPVDTLPKKKRGQTRWEDPW